MIVVAIIPAYSGHRVKSNIAEVINPASGANTSPYESCADDGVMPILVNADTSNLPFVIETRFKTSEFSLQAVNSSQSDDTASVLFTLDNLGGDAETTNVDFVPDAGRSSLRYTCNGANTTAPDKSLPTKCR